MLVLAEISLRQALAIGQDIAGKYSITVDPAALTEVQRNTLLKYTSHHGQDDCLTLNPPHYTDYPSLTDPTTAGLIAWLDQTAAVDAVEEAKKRAREEEDKAREAKQQAEMKAAVRRLMTFSDQQLREAGVGFRYARDRSVTVDGKQINLYRLEQGDEYRWFFGTQERLAKLIEQEQDERDRIEKERQETRELAKRVYLNTWIAYHAEPDDVAQWRDGLLDRATAIRLLADSVLDPIGSRFVGLEDIGECEPCHCESDKAESLSRDGYKAWLQLSKNLPEGAKHEFLVVSRYLHSPKGDYGEPGECHNNAAPTKVECVQVTVPAGPFNFTRTIKLA